MPTPPDGIPWLAWALVVLAIAAIGSLPGLAAALVSRRDMGAIKEQVKNTHSRNLREDVDAAVSSASTAAEAATLASESAHRTERFVEDLSKSIRAIEHSLDRTTKLQGKAIDELRTDLGTHIDSVPTVLAQQVPPMIAEAIGEHLHTCPLHKAE